MNLHMLPPLYGLHSGLNGWHIVCPHGGCTPESKVCGDGVKFPTLHTLFSLCFYGWSFLTSGKVVYIIPTKYGKKSNISSTG